MQTESLGIRKCEQTNNNKEIESVIINVPAQRSPGPDEFTNEYNQTFRAELMPILVKIFHVL